MIHRASLIILFVLGCASCAVAQVKVDRAPVTFQTKYFDPKRPPADMPTLKKNEAAVTVSNFNISSGAGGAVTEPTGGGGNTRVSVKVEQVTVTLGCDIVIWLPNKPPKKIVEHEDGHRQITEHFYDAAEATAQRLAQAWIGQSVVGRGKNPDAAAKAGIQSAIEQLNGQYMAAVHDESSKVQEAFDRLTVHGTNKLTAKQGMDQAFAEYERGKR